MEAGPNKLLTKPPQSPHTLLHPSQRRPGGGKVRRMTPSGTGRGTVVRRHTSVFQGRGSVRGPSFLLHPLSSSPALRSPDPLSLCLRQKTSRHRPPRAPGVREPHFVKVCPYSQTKRDLVSDFLGFREPKRREL